MNKIFLHAHNLIYVSVIIISFLLENVSCAYISNLRFHNYTCHIACSDRKIIVPLSLRDIYSIRTSILELSSAIEYMRILHLNSSQRGKACTQTDRYFSFAYFVIKYRVIRIRNVML